MSEDTDRPFAYFAWSSRRCGNTRCPGVPLSIGSMDDRTDALRFFYLVPALWLLGCPDRSGGFSDFRGALARGATARTSVRFALPRESRASGFSFGASGFLVRRADCSAKGTAPRTSAFGGGGATRNGTGAGEVFLGLVMKAAYSSSGGLLDIRWRSLSAECQSDRKGGQGPVRVVWRLADSGFLGGGCSEDRGSILCLNCNKKDMQPTLCRGGVGACFRSRS